MTAVPARLDLPTVLGCLLMVCAAAPRQDPPATRPDAGPASREARQRWEQLERRLKEPASTPAGLRTDPRRQWLQEFLDQTPPGPKETPLRLLARFHLARYCLADFDLAATESQLRTLLDEASPDTDIEYHLFAEYGLAQLAELRGDLEDALRRYRRLAERTDGGGLYPVFARTARDRLLAQSTLVRNRTVEGLPTRTDLDGAVHDLGAHDGKPLVLVFWSPASAASRKALEAYQRVLREAVARRRAHALAVSLTSSLPEVESAREGIKLPILCGNRGWLDPLALALGVRKVPSLLLLGPNREFLARDLTPEELAEALRALLGG